MPKSQYEIKDLKKVYENRSLTRVDSYKKQSEKEKGLTSGYIAVKDGDTYMMKNSHSASGVALSDKESAEKRDFMTEFMVSPLYKRILYNHAPDIGMAQDEILGNLFLRSKFINNYADLNKYKQKVEFNERGLKKVDGFEKVVAASLFLGEPDYHDENIGITASEEGNSLAVKIDHGRSLWNKSNNSDDLMMQFISSRASYGYNDVEFDVHNFNQAIKSINDISQDEIESLFKIQAYKLQTSGFKPTHEYYGHKIHTPIVYGEKPSNSQVSLATQSASKILVKVKDKPDALLEIIDSKVVLTIEGEEPKEVTSMTPKDLKLLGVSVKRKGEGDSEEMVAKKTLVIDFLGEQNIINENKQRFKALEEHLADKVKDHKIVFQELASKVDIIAQIDADDNFKKNTWVNEIFSTNPSKNIILYALDKGLTIDKKNPLDWMMQNSSNKESQEALSFLTNSKAVKKSKQNLNIDTSLSAKDNSVVEPLSPASVELVEGLGRSLNELSYPAVEKNNIEFNKPLIKTSIVKGR